MPRYFFDIADGVDTQDEGGLELEGLNAARLAAVRLSGELLQHTPDRFWSIGEWSCTVRDAEGLILFTLYFYAQEAPVLSAPRA